MINVFSFQSQPSGNGAMKVTRSSVRRCTLSSTLESPEGSTMCAEITVPSLEMVMLTLMLASSLAALSGGIHSRINAFDDGSITRIGNAAVTGHLNLWWTG